METDINKLQEVDARVMTGKFFLEDIKYLSTGSDAIFEKVKQVHMENALDIRLTIPECRILFLCLYAITEKALRSDKLLESITKASPDVINKHAAKCGMGVIFDGRTVA